MSSTHPICLVVRCSGHRRSSVSQSTGDPVTYSVPVAVVDVDLDTPADPEEWGEHDDGDPDDDVPCRDESDNTIEVELGYTPSLTIVVSFFVPLPLAMVPTNTAKSDCC